MKTEKKRQQQRYDHRLRELVRQSGDPAIVAPLSVPRSTAISWLKEDDQPVITDRILEMESSQLHAEILTLRARLQKLHAIIRLLLVLIRVLGNRLDQTRLPEGAAKARILRAIDRSRDSLSLKGALKVLGLSPSRYYQWRRNEQHCGLDDQLSCPRSTPSRLTAEEIMSIKEMAESPDYRHVPTGRLALLAQRLVAFYVTEHNAHLPHSAFRGETPDEIYYGRGAEVAEELAIAKKQAQTDRITANQARTCQLCQADTIAEDLAPMMA